MENNHDNIKKVTERLLREESRRGSELAFYFRTILVILGFIFYSFELFFKDVFFDTVSFMLLTLLVQSFIIYVIYKKNQIKNLYGFVTVTTDITCLGIHHFISGKYVSGTASITSATLFLYFIIILLSAARQSIRLTAFSTIYSVFVMNIVYFAGSHRLSEFILNNTISSGPDGMLFRSIYVIFFGIIMIFIMKRTFNMINNQVMIIDREALTSEKLTKEQKKKKRLEERFRHLLKNLRSEYFFYSQDAYGNIYYVSPSVENMLGYEPSDFRKNFGKYVVDNEKNQITIKKAWEKLKEKNPFPYELEIYTSENRIRRLEILEIPIYNEKGKLSSIEGIAHDITNKKELENVLKNSEQKIKAYARRLVEIREEEKKKLSANLHDELGTMAIAVGANLNIAQADIEDKNYKNAKKILNDTKTLLKDSIIKLKSIAKELRPPNIEMFGIAAALQLYFEEIEEKHNIRISFDTNIKSNTIPEEISINLYRIAQEAITNSIKYSKTRKIVVKIKEFKNRLEMVIKDSGIGFDADSIDEMNGKLGILGMRERVEALSGRFLLNSTPGKGTEIRFEVPLTL